MSFTFLQTYYFKDLVDRINSATQIMDSLQDKNFAQAEYLGVSWYGVGHDQYLRVFEALSLLLEDLCKQFHKFEQQVETALKKYMYEDLKLAGIIQGELADRLIKNPNLDISDGGFVLKPFTYTNKKGNTMNYGKGGGAKGLTLNTPLRIKNTEKPQTMREVYKETMFSTTDLGTRQGSEQSAEHRKEAPKKVSEKDEAAAEEQLKTYPNFVSGSNAN